MKLNHRNPPSPPRSSGAVVAARGQAVIVLTVTPSAQAPNECRKVSFPLTYAGKADQWH